MKVIFTRSNPVSPDPRVEKQVLTLCREGFEVSILGWNRDLSEDLRSDIRVGGYVVPIFRAKIKSKFGGGVGNIKSLFLFQLFLIWNLFRRRNEYDVIHAADFDTIFPALLMKAFFKKKLVYDIYDFYIDAFSVPGYAKPIIKRLDFIAINNADAVVLTNESRLEQIKGSTPKSLYYIHNSPEDVEVSTHQVASDNYDVRVSYVGVLQDFRLISEVLEVFSENPSWELMIAGFGPLEDEVISLASRYKNIKFYGKVSYAAGLEISNSADVLFATYDPKVPNHKYSSPNKLYEAMMLSLPIIVSRDTGIDVLVEKNAIGIAIDHSKEGFESAIREIAEMSRYDRLKMGKAARKMYDERYSWKKMQEVLLDMYNTI